MTKKREPAARTRAGTPDPGQFRRESRRNTGGRRVNPAPDQAKPEEEDATDE